MDDTILNYSDSSEACWDAACQESVQHFSALSPKQLREEIRTQGRWYWSDAERARAGRLAMHQAYSEIVNGALRKLDFDFGLNLATRIARSYMDAHQRQITLFPEAIGVLESLRAASVRLALLTNGHPKEQRPKIERFGLAAYFDCIIIEGEFGIGKPHQDVFRHALETVKASPAEAWMVGDNLVADIAGAQSLGIHAVWRDVRGEGVPHDIAVTPDRIVSRLDELLPQ